MCNDEQHEGGGLFGPRYRESPCETGDFALSSTADTASVWGGGGGFGQTSGCNTAPSFSGWGIGVLLLLGFFWSAAFAQDLQTVQVLDGDMVAVRSGQHAPRFAPWATLTHHTGLAPVTATSQLGTRIVVDQLSTTELSLGWSFGMLQIGVNLPHHSLRMAVPEGEPKQIERGLGDLLFMVSASTPTKWGRLGFRTTYERPVGRAPVSAHAGATAAISMAGKGKIRPAGHVGVRIQKKAAVPGQIIGNRLEAGLGVHWQPKPWAAVMVESIASFPIADGFLWRAAPIELIGAFEARPAPGIAVRPFLGFGLTKGLGSARGRLGLSLRTQGHAPRDTDGDGYSDLRDICPRRPEDRDGFRDADGCPDPDNDQDGILDLEDSCPVDAEERNGLLDADGCPDAWPRLEIQVESPEVVTVTVGDDQRRMLAGERWSLEQGLDAVRVMAEAPGHLGRGWSVHQGPNEVMELSIRLQPEARSPLCFQIEDGTGTLLPVDVSGDLQANFEGRHCEDVLHGMLMLDLASEGFPTEHTTVSVQGPTVLHLVMLKPQVLLEGRTIRLNQSLQFEHGDDSLRAVDPGMLDALAAWLKANPWILLVSIEGHADTIGGSAYNYALSGRRAARVTQALIDRGIAAERLEPRSWGESEARQGPERSVGFTVLVVDEESMP